jgi:uncharacterized protein
MKIEAFAATGRPFVDGYGDGGFRIGGVEHKGPLFLLPDGVLPWAAADAAQITAESLAPLVGRGDIEVLLVGCGARMTLLPKAVREALRRAGIVADAMDTGAACRTFNVLLSENRRVAAALIPV